MHFVSAKGILSSQNGMNIYRGCTHGCIYCDSRSLCYGMKHEFEDIEVKQNAPELLRDALRRKRARCMISTGAMCDPYMHCEGELRLTRRCLEVIEELGFGLAVQTKSDLILRDIDLLDRINRRARCVVEMTLTTFDEDLCRIIERDVCTTRRRFEALLELRGRGIPTVVWLTPILPFINDTEENIRGLLSYCREAGVRGVISFGMGVTLRAGDRDYFYSALDASFPGLRRRYVERYGDAYVCESERSGALTAILREECLSAGIMCDVGEVFGYIGDFPISEAEQLSIFD